MAAKTSTARPFIRPLPRTVYLNPPAAPLSVNIPDSLRNDYFYELISDFICYV